MLDITQIYKTNNCGPIRVVHYHNALKVEVQFIETGYKATAQASNIRAGRVKDYLVPNVLGVGFIGDGPHKAWVNGKETKAYKAWQAMFTRCYCQKTLGRQPTYKGCTVAKEWHNFQGFGDFFEKSYIDGYELDKDIIKKGNRIYCPEFCKFVTPESNIIEGTAKNYAFISPAGVLTKIYNMSAFCRDNNLGNSKMSMVHTGRLKHYKGWTKNNKTERLCGLII